MILPASFTALLLVLIPAATSSPLPSSSSFLSPSHPLPLPLPDQLLLSKDLSKPTPIVPVVIWHGLGDRYDAPGLLSLKEDLESRPSLKGIFVHILALAPSGPEDQRATFFGSANSQIDFAAAQLLEIPEIMDPSLNEAGEGVFDAIGFSQGGQLLRGLVERYGAAGGGGGKLRVRNLITLGSQHLGISSLPPCPPGSSPLSPCRLMHLSLVREGVYSSFAQRNIVPAQYFRDPERLEDYFETNTFLKDINNELEGDKQPLPGPDGTLKVLLQDDDGPERNLTYKTNFASLSNLVLYRFSKDETVVPPHSSHFTLPSPFAENCPVPPIPGEPCYLDPLPWSYLPLYSQDYIGLKELDWAKKVKLGVCEGEHMRIDDECWEGVVGWLGPVKKEAESTGLVIQS